MNKTYKKEPLRGNGKAIKFANGGEIINVVFPEADLQKMGSFMSKNGDKFFSFSIAAKKEEDQFGNTHWMYVSKVDDGNTSGTPNTPQAPASTTGYSPVAPKEDDFPF